MKTILLFSFLLLAISYNYAQTYAELITRGDSLYQAKDFIHSARAYNEAFRVNGDKGNVNDRYNAACSWALAGQPDSAFVQLFRIAEKGNYTNYNHLTKDSDLNSLHSDERWKKVTALVLQNKEKAEANLNKPLVAELETIYEEDQKYRRMIDSIDRNFGMESPEMQQLWKIIAEKDSINLIKVSKILDQYGWLGPDVVGAQGSVTLFLVIQHSPLEVQLKYVPLLREAVKNGKANAANLALLEDRILMFQGKKQLYGSQLRMNQQTGKYELAPIEDPKNVDKRRAEVGLGPLADYVKRWGIVWDAEAHEKAHGNK
ncbi:MAG: DUF6624 domain-containing protein [Saprospiraceae bacterium]